MNTKEKVIVLTSGGLDSTAALYDANEKYQVIAGLGFDYGSKHNRRELPMAKYHCDKLGIKFETITLDFIDKHFKSDLLKSGGAIPDGHYEEDSMKQTVVPFRNGIMLSVAAGYAESIGAAGLVIAAHSGDHAIYPDCREPFMIAIGNAINSGTYANLKLYRPFIDLNKAEIATLGQSLGVDFAYTYSCYKGGEIHCGSCGTCVERREAFINSGVYDPTEYLSIKPLPSKPVKPAKPE